MNPYEILEVNRNATDQEVKAAYNKLVKKYHPDAYNDNPLKDLAEEKLREVNEAYDMIMKERKGGTSSSYKSSSSGGGKIYMDVRTEIERGNIIGAEQLLRTKERTAEFYFLTSVIDFRKGNFNRGIDNLNQAIALDPTNVEYNQARNQVLNQGNAFNQYQGSPYAYQAGRSDQERQCCQCLGAYCCLDALCGAC